jgi:hypothetical protein
MILWNSFVYEIIIVNVKNHKNTIHQEPSTKHVPCTFSPTSIYIYFFFLVMNDTSTRLIKFFFFFFFTKFDNKE